MAFVVLQATGCGSVIDDHLCGSAGCEWSTEEWGRLAALSGLPATAPADPSNRYVGDAAAQALGKQWFFDTRFAGTATLVDQLKRPVPYARAAKGTTMAVSCATCHDLDNAGIDDTSSPNNISIGAGWFDVNAQSTMNAAFYQLSFWDGRVDSLWAQALAATEGGVSMNGSRLQVAWAINDHYHDAFQAAFPDVTLPMTGTATALAATLQTTGAGAGQCTPVNGACPDGCRTTADAAGGAPGCWPRFPLQGRPGSKPGCQVGDASEPFGDAWDCMDPDDQAIVTRIFVDYGKAVAAYEAQLISRDSPFDRYVAAGPDSGLISPQAEQGAKLFVGKAACSDCHNTPLLSDNRFHDIGVPQLGPGVPTEAECPAGGVCDCVETPATVDGAGNTVPAKAAKNCLPWGGRDGIAKLAKNPFLRTSAWSDDPADTSRQRFVSMSPDDVPAGAWRTPTLRDVALTAPYMHDGVYATLEEVIDHYDRGGAAGGAVGVPAAQIKPLFLTSEEKSDLVEFLKTLTGEPTAPGPSHPAGAAMRRVAWRPLAPGLILLLAPAAQAAPGRAVAQAGTGAPALAAQPDEGAAAAPATGDTADDESLEEAATPLSERIHDLETRLEQTRQVAVGRTPRVTVGGYIDARLLRPAGRRLGHHPDSRPEPALPRVRGQVRLGVPGRHPGARRQLAGRGGRPGRRRRRRPLRQHPLGRGAGLHLNEVNLTLTAALSSNGAGHRQRQLRPAQRVELLAGRLRWTSTWRSSSGCPPRRRSPRSSSARWTR